MSGAELTVDRDFPVGAIDPRLFGSFAEHLGRCVYGGLYEPGHPAAGADGLREDVLALTRELGVTAVRYPGGNFVSGYCWEDGVGPRRERPVRLEPAWMSRESNQFGTNEFMDWCRRAGVEPMMAVNLGTRGAADAANLLEYCNVPGGSRYSDLRRAHGYEQPHGVKLWCLGNEMDGPWQIGHKSAPEYGSLAFQTGKLMKSIDPEIKLVVCGSSHMGMPTFGEWEQTVLEHTFDIADYISLHTYYGNGEDNTPLFLARPDEMDRFIERVTSFADAVAARRRSEKKIMLSFDEWNVWFHSTGADKAHYAERAWPQAPALLEDVYTLEDALVVGGMLMSLLNHSDRVKAACLAQLVNVIGAIMTETGGPAWRQTIFHPFAQAARFGRGQTLRQALCADTYDAGALHGVPLLKAAVTHEAASGRVALFLLNRDLEKPLDLRVRLRGFAGLRLCGQSLLAGAGLKTVNDRTDGARVAPREAEGAAKAALQGEELRVTLAPASWNVVQLAQA